MVSACFVDRTYAYIDPKSTCIALLSETGIFPQRKMKRPVRSYFKTERIPPSSFDSEINPYSNMEIFTAHIHWHRSSSLTMTGTDSALLDVGFQKYHGKFAYYNSTRNALRSVIVRTLVKVACEWEDEGEDPLWSKRLLPADGNQDNVRDFGGNKRDYVVLYQQGNSDRQNDRLFGFLQFRYGKRVLSIPRDSNDWTVPWQDFVFDEYPHLSKRSELRMGKCT